MKARDVVGRKIVGIHQTRIWDTEQQQWEINLDSIQLDNGTSILLMTHEIPYDSIVHAFIHRRNND